jgi:hypothetical protein
MLKAWAWGTYIFFSVFLAGGIVWVYFYLPETMNATLEEMDRVFKSHTGEADERLLDEVKREIGLLPPSSASVSGNDEMDKPTIMAEEKYLEKGM